MFTKHFRRFSTDLVTRYLASDQSGPFIREVSAHVDIANVCLTYLMLTSFDLSITEEEIDKAILDGHYVLQAYATTHWLDHVIEGVRGDMGSTDLRVLCQKIWPFLAKRSNQNFDRKSAKNVDVPELKQFEKIDKALYRDLCYIHSSVASELSGSLKETKKNCECLSYLCSGREIAVTQYKYLRVCGAIFICKDHAGMFKYFQDRSMMITCFKQPLSNQPARLLARMSFAWSLSIRIYAYVFHMRYSDL